MFSAARVATSFVVVLTVFSIAGFSQLSSVDPSFAPVVSSTLASDGVAVQADGKAIIWGGNIVVDGVAKGRVARLNVDGSVDNTFAYCNCLLDTVNNAAVQSDGKILVAGTANNHARVARLNSDGSQDTSFASVFNDGGSTTSNATFNTFQPDGKLIVQLTEGFNTGYHQASVVRLNTDGSRDTSFTAIFYDAGQIISGGLDALAIDLSGKIYTATTVFSGAGTTSYLKRYNSNGTPDSGWTAPNVGPSFSRYGGLAVESDGSLLISGNFDSVNGVSKPRLVRILPAGNVDLGFTAPPLGSGGGQLSPLPSGKILVAYNITGNGLLTRVNSDGSADGTFALSPTVNVITSKYTVDLSGRILFFGVSSTSAARLFRLNPPGDADASFNPNITRYGIVRSLAVQSDGKVVVAGNFIQLNGVERALIGRVNSDGTLDPTFDPGTGFNQPPGRLVIQSDGKIIAAGNFTSYNGSARPGLVRLNTDGSIDNSFAPAIVGGVVTASVQSDGRILIGGNFTSIDSVARTGAARLSSAGVLDNVFNPIIGTPFISDIFQQSDGKIMVGGSFSGVNGFNRTAMVRLNDDGSLDMTFDSTGVGAITKIWRQPDGKYIVDGNNANLRRRNANGSSDNTFTSPTLDTFGGSGRSVDAVIVQADGTLIVGGRFDTVNGITRRNLLRLTANGSVDRPFFPSGADAAVRAAVRQADGKVIIGGEFGKVGGVSRAGSARLTIAPYHAVAPFDFDGDGRADISVLRSSTNRWYELLSSNSTVAEETFGLAGDIPTPADFDGDGITDESIFRPSNGQWWYKSSINGSQVVNNLGVAGDIPRPSDFDGDGRADFVVFRPSTNTWRRFGSSVGLVADAVFGLAGDQPLVGDFDGDGKSDLAIFRPSSGDWWYAASSAGNQFRTAHWGQNGDIPVPADYDGDGKTDHAIFRPSDGGWYIYNSGNGSFTILPFGLSSDRPVAADYDSDGRADIAVFRPSTGAWYLLQSTSGFAGAQFGISTDTALPGSLIP